MDVDRGFVYRLERAARGEELIAEPGQPARESGQAGLVANRQ
jgi:hypothetical protein